MGFEIFGKVIAIAILDSVNVSSLTMTSFLVTLPNRRALVRSYLSAIAGLYFGVGALIVFTLERFIDRLAKPWIPHLVEAAIGITLIVKFNGAKPKPYARLPQVATMSPARAFGLGLLMTVFDLSTALPYFGALAVIARSNVGTASTLLLLGIYNAVFVLPCVVMAVVANQSGSRHFQRFWAKVQEPKLSVSPRVRLIRVALQLVGVVLIFNAAGYFLTGTAPLSVS
jgi:cytochrome c biogenesis protein CcdA